MDFKLGNERALELLMTRKSETRSEEFLQEIENAEDLINQSDVAPFNFVRQDNFKIYDTNAKVIFDGYYIKLRVVHPEGCTGWGEMWIANA